MIKVLTLLYIAKKGMNCKTNIDLMEKIYYQCNVEKHKKRCNPENCVTNYNDFNDNLAESPFCS